MKDSLRCATLTCDSGREEQALRVARHMGAVLEKEVLRLISQGVGQDDMLLVSREDFLEREIWVGGQRRVSITLPFSVWRYS